MTSEGYFELGKLQPDLNSDDLLIKRANKERVKEFSSNLRKINKDMGIIPPARPGGAGEDHHTVSSNRSAIDVERAEKMALRKKVRKAKT